jgi:hypothetical protein
VIPIQDLVQSRLDDLASQIQYLYTNGDFVTANLLKKEGLDLAEHADNPDYDFFCVEDQSFSL